MPLVRKDDGTWILQATSFEEKWWLKRQRNVYPTLLPRYLTALDPIFSKAWEASEFEFIMSVLRVRGVQDAGWDPFENTLRTLPKLRQFYRKCTDFEAERTLALWLYGHIVEASEPYELLANLLEIINGGRFKLTHFPPRKDGRPLSPETKIKILKSSAEKGGLVNCLKPLEEVWNRELRNAVFHSDYVLYGNDVRLMRPPKTYTGERIMNYVNCAVAYFDALIALYDQAIKSFKEPKTIKIHPDFSHDPEEQAVVIVRKDHGAIGLKDAWTADQLRAGKIRFRMGRFLPSEIQLLTEK